MGKRETIMLSMSSIREKLTQVTADLKEKSKTVSKQQLLAWRRYKNNLTADLKRKQAQLVAADEEPKAHQFSLFSYNVTKPKIKVPISAERIKQAKELIAKGMGKDAAAVLRGIRERLEDFENRLNSQRHG